MWPLSVAAQIALVTHHRVDIRATAYNTIVGTVGDLPVSSGSVSIDATNQVRRSGTVGIADPTLWPADPVALLSPLGAELAVDYGIVLASGATEWVPLIRGVVTTAARSFPLSSGDAVTLTLSDRSATVAQNRFDAPVTTTAGATTVAEITRLITEAMPDAVVLDLTGDARVAATLTMDKERWADGIEKLADSISAEVFVDPVGQFVIRRQPTLAGDPSWLIAAGNGGVLLGYGDSRTREQVYNRVVAFGQRTDGVPPVWAAAADTNPASPTWVGGGFGVRTRFYSSPLLTTTAQCATTAASLLARIAGLVNPVTLNTMVNPALDAGDVLLVAHRGKTRRHIVDTCTVPFGVSETQSITTRASDVLPEET